MGAVSEPHCTTCVCGRRAPVQDERGNGRGPDMPEGSVSWDEHLEVWTRYAALHGSRQTAERMAERGGFGFYEAQGYLGRPLKTWSVRGRERVGGGW